jgi:hypothetical protein
MLRLVDHALKLDQDLDQLAADTGQAISLSIYAPWAGEVVKNHSDHAIVTAMLRQREEIHRLRDVIASDIGGFEYIAELADQDPTKFRQKIVEPDTIVQVANENADGAHQALFTGKRRTKSFGAARRREIQKASSDAAKATSARKRAGV